MLLRMTHMGTRLRDWRKGAGLSQEELAERLGVFQTTISHYERGTLRPGLAEALKLEELAGIAPRDWLHDTSDADDAAETQPGASEQVVP
jgi:transcriptional regulator with XRE-family HTH domain